jgi:hypothetical protein
MWKINIGNQDFITYLSPQSPIFGRSMGNQDFIASFSPQSPIFNVVQEIEKN